MMPLQNTLSTFLNRIHEIKVHSYFVNTSIELTRSIAPYIDRGSLATNVPLMKDYELYHRSVAQIRSGDVRAALIVQAFSALEWFVRALLLVSIEYIDSHTEKFCELPSNVARMNIHLSGRALAIQAEAKQHNRVDVDQYCRGLGGCYADNESFNLNSSAFGMFMKNLNSKVLAEVLKRVGYDINWDKIGANKELQKIVGETSVRKAGKAAKELFNQLSKRRNEIAHQGDGSIDVSEHEIDKYLAFLVAVSISLTKGIEECIKKNH